METLAGKVREAATVLAFMEVQADMVANIKNTWNAIRETDPAKKVQTFIDRSRNAVKRWVQDKMPNLAKALSEGTEGNVILTPAGELISRDRRVRVKI